jgi:hypothetical protein
MSKYWLLDQHGGEGPTALVETDGSMHIVRVLRFGPGITELDAQQEIWDKVIGRVAPTLKPFAEASKIHEEGVEPHEKLQRGDYGGPGATNRAGRRGSGRRSADVGRVGGSANSRRSRGDR